MKRIFHIDGSQPGPFHIFVFGSNLSGIHGAGAARAAFRYYSAQWGVGEGPTGRTYAIPTVLEHIAGPLPLSKIKAAVDRFIDFAIDNPHMQFFVTRVGCGLAGHRDADIAPMFFNAPKNCSLPDSWESIINKLDTELVP